MVEDTIPAPPKPFGELKTKEKKKGFLGMFKGKKKDKKKSKKENKSQDVDAQLLNVETKQKDEIKELEKENSREEKVLEKEKVKLQEEKQKEIDPSSEEFASLEAELEAPDEEKPKDPEGEVNLDDLEKLEADLNIDSPKEPKKKSKKGKKDKKDSKKKEEPVIEPETPLDEEPPALDSFDDIPEIEQPPSGLDEDPEKEGIVQEDIPNLAEVPDVSDAPVKEVKKTHKGKKPKKTSAAKVEKPKKAAIKPVSKEPDVPEPKLKNFEIKQTAHEPKVKEVKIRKRAKVEKHFKGLEKDHKKIYSEIHKTITDPYQKIPPAHFFVLKDGKPVKNLKELIKSLEIIDENTFAHHVNAQKNDFANWIKDILKKEKLATTVGKKKAKAELLKVLKDHDDQVHKEFKQQKATADVWKKEQLKLIDKVRKARDELYDLQSELDSREADLNKKANFVQKSKAFDVQAYKKQLKTHFDAKQKQKLKELDSVKKALQKEKQVIIKQQSILKKQQASATALEKKYKLGVAGYDKQAKQLKEKEASIQKSMKKFREEEANIKKKRAELARLEKSIDVKNRVSERKETKIQEMLSADQELKATLDDMQSRINHQKSAIENQGFKEYVREELGQLYTQHNNTVTNIDGSLDRSTDKHADIHDLINGCKQLLNQNKIAEAQRMYNEIKTEFGNRSIPPEEKTKLHRQILELYDDIHLALMR